MVEKDRKFICVQVMTADYHYRSRFAVSDTILRTGFRYPRASTRSPGKSALRVSGNLERHLPPFAISSYLQEQPRTKPYFLLMKSLSSRGEGA